MSQFPWSDEVSEIAPLYILDKLFSCIHSLSNILAFRETIHIGCREDTSGE